jgi:endonuclease-8
VPEGDVVWRTARQLDQALTGRVLTRTDFRVPRYASADLRGQTVTAAAARGKHLLVRTDAGQTVHSHLKMDGSWRIRRAAGPPPRDHRVRLVLANADWMAVGSLLSLVQVVPTSQEDQLVGHLGPDLLGPDWDAAEAVRRLQQDPARPAGEALLDQRNLAGIGNVYKCELLFLRGVSPWRPVGEITSLDAMARLAHRLLEANKNRNGHITTGVMQRGREHWVYGRAGLPCRRCGTRIQSASTGIAGGAPKDRITFWCPSCQPAG